MRVNTRDINSTRGTSSNWFEIQYRINRAFQNLSPNFMFLFQSSLPLAQKTSSFDFLFLLTNWWTNWPACPSGIGVIDDCLFAEWQDDQLTPIHQHGCTTAIWIDTNQRNVVVGGKATLKHRENNNMWILQQSMYKHQDKIINVIWVS